MPSNFDLGVLMNLWLGNNSSTAGGLLNSRWVLLAVPFIISVGIVESEASANPISNSYYTEEKKVVIPEVKTSDSCIKLGGIWSNLDRQTQLELQTQMSFACMVFGKDTVTISNNSDLTIPKNDSVKQLENENSVGIEIKTISKKFTICSLKFSARKIDKLNYLGELTNKEINTYSNENLAADNCKIKLELSSDQTLLRVSSNRSCIT